MKNALVAIVVSLLVSLCVGVYLDHARSYSQWSSQAQKHIDTIQQAINKAIQKVSPSVVSIVVAQEVEIFREDPFGFFHQNNVIKQQLWGGTGVVISPDGLILTNKHVIARTNASYVIITHTGYEIPATLIATDPITDIAILQADIWDKKLKPVVFTEKQESIDVGDMVIAIGNALWELNNSSTFWIISAKNRSINVSKDGITKYLHGLLQTDAAINQWNSGGPLINLAGEVIGINTASTNTGTWVGFAIPYSEKQISANIASIQRNGTIERAYLGVFSVTLTPAIAQKEWLIHNFWAYIPHITDAVIPGSPAQKAGIIAGDIITHIDWIQLSGDRQLQSILSSKIPNEIVNVSLLRGTQDINTTVTLGVRR